MLIITLLTTATTSRLKKQTEILAKQGKTSTDCTSGIPSCYVYHIDEDAYHLLDNYLANLRIHFRREEGAEEIVHDMELRISELFADRLNEGKQVITIEDVEEIIGPDG